MLTLSALREHLELVEQLRTRKSAMLEPQDLPGRYGLVVQGVDAVLQAISCEAVLGGGWAVWHHGYLGRYTQDLDIALPQNRVEEFLRVAAVSGFDVLRPTSGRWPRLQHRDTQIDVDI